VATDTLEIFGTEYTGVTGIKATDDNGDVLAYIRPLTIPVTFVNHRNVSTSIRYTPSFTNNMPVNSSGYITTNVVKLISSNSQVDTLFFKNAFVSIESTEANGDFELRSNNTVIAPKYQYKYWSGIRYYYYKCYTFSSTVLPDTGGTIDIYDCSDPVPEAVTIDTLSVTTNDTYTAPAGTAYSEVTVNVSGGGSPTLQTKTATPTESAQVITADSGYDGLDEVDVAAISPTYVGSGITRRSSSDLTDSGATVTVPSGYYESQASKTITNGMVNPPGTITATDATVSTGTNTLTLSKSNISTATSVVFAGYVSSSTSGYTTATLTASVPTKAAATITPGTTDQTIASGTYLTGAQTISGDANLVAGNIKSGTTIFGVTGNYSGGGSVNIASTTWTCSNTSTLSHEFTGLNGTPKAAFLRCTTQLTRSSSQSYYYIADIVWDGTECRGNYHLRSNGTYTNCTATAASHYTVTVGTNSITFNSQATSRSYAPGSFYNGTYELVYIY
jgi:hypothetical protein